MSELISTRIEKNVSEEINKLAKQKNVGKTIVLRNIIMKGLADEKLELSLNLYKKGKVTLWKAAEIAQINIWKFIEEIKKERIAIKYSLEDAKEEIKQVFG